MLAPLYFMPRSRGKSSPRREREKGEFAWFSSFVICFSRNESGVDDDDNFPAITSEEQEGSCRNNIREQRDSHKPKALIIACAKREREREKVQAQVLQEVLCVLRRRRRRRRRVRLDSHKENSVLQLP